VLHQAGDYHGSYERLSAAISLYVQLGNRRGEVEALNEIGAVSLQLDRLDAADEFYRRAMALSQTITSRRDEANAMAGLGRLSDRQGRLDAGLMQLRAALAIMNEIGAADAASLAAEIADRSDEHLND
jgi:tetratricopeptide (TPR) repeat protein